MVIKTIMKMIKWYVLVIKRFRVQFGVNKHEQRFFKDNKIARACEASGMCNLWTIYNCFFTPNCIRNHVIIYKLFTWEIMIKTDSENINKDKNSLNEIVTHITHVFAHTMLGLYEIMPTIIFILTVK